MDIRAQHERDAPSWVVLIELSLIQLDRLARM